LAVDLEREIDDTVFPGGSSDGVITVKLLQLSSTMPDGSGSVDVFFALDLRCGTDGRTITRLDIFLAGDLERGMDDNKNDF